MKKSLVISVQVTVLCLLFISLYSLTDSENKNNVLSGTVSPDPDEFLVGAYSIGCASQNRLQELGLNIWQNFLGRKYISILGYNQTNFPHGVTDNDSLFSDVSRYESEVTGYYYSRTQLNNNYLYLTRPKIEMLTFAQRSDYHPLSITVNGTHPSGKKWFYGYNELDRNVAEEITDSKMTVRYSQAGRHTAGHVVKSLRPTWEQVKNAVPNDLFYDAIYSWYIS